MEKFLASGYDIEGEKYYSFEQIGNYLFPDLETVWATQKVRNVYKYRQNSLKKYSLKTKSRIYNQQIVVLNLQGVKELCKYTKRTKSDEGWRKQHFV